MGKRINCLILNNEIWAIALRLHYEYDFFDHFIITESRMTFSGEWKPLYFEKYRNEIADPDNKIIYDIIDTLPTEHETEYMTQDGKRVVGNRWPADHAMRNSSAKVLKAMNLGRDDIVVVQDIDEIANLDAIADYSTKLADNEIHRLVYHDFRETVEPKGLKPTPWNGGIMFCGARVHEDYHDMRRLYMMRDIGVAHWHIQSPLFVSKLDGSPMYELIRRPDLKSSIGDPLREPMGWHFSSMSGGFKKLRVHKTNSFSHKEFDTSDWRPKSDDFWAETKAFIAKAKANGGYEGKTLSDKLPDFVRSRIDEFPILINAKAPA